MMSPPRESDQWSYEDFTRKVKKHMAQGQFSDLLGATSVKILQLRREAAYLYDAVRLYAKSLRETLFEGGDPSNGTEIVRRLFNKTYFRWVHVNW